jgi:hypothetical protein
MILGIDFDNTIVNYDHVFHKVALENNLIPQELDVSKAEVRRYFREIGKESEWTELQGYVYGARMAEALPFPHSLEYITRWIRSGVEVYIVSHKTRTPYSGTSYDLHKAGWQWLELQGFFDRDRINLKKCNVFFELTKQDKIYRIADLKCTHFVDDLPELLTDPSFPAEVEKILFDPSQQILGLPGVLKVVSWLELNTIIERDQLRETN